MNDKKKKIIQSALKLFGEKGYHSSSIQEISEASGLAKSSFYNYFHSKEELMITIIKYYYELLVDRVNSIEEIADLPTREKFCQQLTIQINEFIKHKDFIQMQLREQSIEVNDEIHKLLFKLRAESIHWYSTQLKEIYGEKIKDHLLDCTTMLNGIIKEYMFYLIVDKVDINTDKLASYILDRMDGIVASINPKDKPLLDVESMINFINYKRNTLENAKSLVLNEINEFKSKINASKFNKLDFEKIMSSLEAIEDELENEHPKIVVIQGLFLFLKSFNQSIIDEMITKVDQIVKSRLI
ncbi:MAG: transcriptional regulator, TetR family [Bacillales bacterium]|jgi:AcrR family transcriptional regulator|nr:transcriptional regulator, TetR family [Bacillales bacterium]